MSNFFCIKRAIYYITVFLSAFLLFQIQPMSSQLLLPVFGGSYAVWGACVVFYQIILLFAYGWAHFSQQRLGVGRYAYLHIILLICAAFLQARQYIHSNNAGALVAITIFVNLLVSVGAPVFMLAGTSPVIQRWFALDGTDRVNPYVLYASSNLGSMLGLLLYPCVIQPLLNLGEQFRLWNVLFVVTVVFHVFCFLFILKSPAVKHIEGVNKTSKIIKRDIIRRLILSAVPVIMMLAVTNILTLDIAPGPYLWVLPLAVYLLSFVLAFKQKPLGQIWMEQLFPWALFLGMILMLGMQWRLALPPFVSILLHLAILFCISLTCNINLVRIKPDDVSELTAYYLIIAVGGAVGGVLVSWILPLVSDFFVEYPLACTLAAFTAACCDIKDFSVADLKKQFLRVPLNLVLYVIVAIVALICVPWFASRFLSLGVTKTLAATGGFIVSGLVLGMCILGVLKKPSQLAILLLISTIAFRWTEDMANHNQSIKRFRNYYGIYKVYERDSVRYLQHGTTLHGSQVINQPGIPVPMAYFHPSTPAASFLLQYGWKYTDIGMIGLGTGALATYACSGQNFYIFELDPDNVYIAEKYFGYLEAGRNRGAKISIVTGDGRMSLAKIKDETFDIFIVDAFNSGSIPVHLITVEAFKEYFRVLKKDGILFLHVSNKALSLEPVVYSNARLMEGVYAVEKSNVGDVQTGATLTCWMALTKSSEIMDILKKTRWYIRFRPRHQLPRPWTDHYSNIFSAML